MEEVIYKELEKIVIDGEKNILGFATKIFIINEMKGYVHYDDLKYIEKTKLLDYIYKYWGENDFVENHLCDIIWLVFQETNIIKDIENINYEDFEKIMDKLV